MSFIYIEFEEDEHIFDDAEEAEEFLMKHCEDGNEFYLTWRNDDGDVIEEEGWMYSAPTFDDEDQKGEFKISPDAASGDYDSNCQWISSDDGEVFEALSQYL